MVRLGDSIMNPLEIAKELAGYGLKVFPAKHRGKSPFVKWGDYQGIDSSHMLEKWFAGRSNINYWVATGLDSGYIVIDCDSKEADEWWREQLGDEVMDATAQVQTPNGVHYWFRLPEGKGLPSWSVHPGDDDDHNISFDLRADGTGVIAPPSTHKTGVLYKWLKPLDQAQPVPPAILDGTARRNAPVATGDASGGATGTGGQARSLLSSLLERPPGGEGSGRNDWLAKVAGHYAKTYHNFEDLYKVHCSDANQKMGTPLDDDEFHKTIESVWKIEHERNAHRAIDKTCGWLVSASTVMMCQVRLKQGDDVVYDFAEYADFDLHAKGVMIDDANRRTYWAEIVRIKRGGDEDVERIDIVLRAETLGDERSFKKFLAGFACTIVPPENMAPAKVGPPGVRIQRYLESQHPPVVTISPALGFDPDALGEGRGGFITHDGAISSTGLHGIDEVSVRADPRLKSGGMASHEYGFEDNETVARQVLTNVLTFHDEAVTSVFGAWWASCLLKPQIQDYTSLFPFMAIEAPSESGKTNGYFAMMTQLNGNTRGEMQPTKAALRDMLAAHRNGITWVDDLDDPAYLMELLRAATSGGSLSKMGEDRESVINKQIVAPVVISGEALGLGTQKALIDRAILLKAPTPTSRRSEHDPNVPQWEDVLAVRNRYPDGLHTIAGWLVQDALSVTEETISAVRAGRTGGSGRASDKVAVLRAGARLLDYLVRSPGAWAGKGLHAGRVEAWLGNHLVDQDGIPIVSNENALTLELIPWALRKWKMPEKPLAGENEKESDTPVYVKNLGSGDARLFGSDTSVHFNCDLLAEAWKLNEHGRQEKRTTTADALRDQAAAIGAKSKRARVGNSGGRLAYYYELRGDVAEACVRRAVGK